MPYVRRNSARSWLVTRYVNGEREHRSFPTEDEARTWAAQFSSVRSRPCTPEQVRQKIASRIAIDKDTGCHVWTRALDRNGYARLKWRRSAESPEFLAHRISYILAVGEIPEGLVIDHLCRNTACVNPEHLEAVTPGENTRRGLAFAEVAGRCRSGRHLILSADDMTANGPGRRICRACKQGNAKAYYLKREATA